MPLQAAADASNTTSPSAISTMGTMPPIGVSCRAWVTGRPFGDGRGERGPQRRVGYAEARFLAFHVAAGLPIHSHVQVDLIILIFPLLMPKSTMMFLT